MKALVKTAKGPGHVELKSDWPKPVVRPGWVLVEVVASGICGTDVHILEDTHKNWPPVVLGHEYTGRIVEVGNDCGSWKVGDRVVCEQHTLACMSCDACRRGAIHLCPAKRSPGWGIEPTAICITGIDRAGIAIGERVVVVGPGPIGLISAMLVKAAGASAVSALGDTFDLAIDSTGAGESLTLCALLTRRLGRVLELGLANQSEVPFNINAATTKSITIFTSLSSEYSSWDRALAFMASKKYDPAILTSIYPLEQWEEAFADVESRKVVKGVITPQDISVLDQTQ
jgi:threonine dehydrogenase-like Zn-dependent dehydrogenase